jgi:hypothetical protein
MMQIESFCNEIIKLNGTFYNGISFNFDKPEYFNQHPYEQALLGELFVNTRNHIGKYQGNYLLYVQNEVGYIRIKILSSDKKCELHIAKTDNEIDDRIKYEKDAFEIEFNYFTEIINKNTFCITNL